MAPKPPVFSPAQLEAICRALGETDSGLKGSEINHFLRQVRVENPDPSITKWQRIYNALAARQNTDRSGDRVLAFISVALAPARYAGERSVFDRRRTEVNVPLAFYGLEFGEDGRFHTVNRAASLSEAEERAHRLRAALSGRGVHPDVLTYCRAELLQNNCFHAVLEATKGVAEKIRRRARLTGDGAQLVDDALSGDAPRLRINSFESDTHRSEQRGFVNLLKGLFGTFRNPVSHAPRIAWNVSEEDALDLFSLASYAHRRIDRASA